MTYDTKMNNYLLYTGAIQHHKYIVWSSLFMNKYDKETPQCTAIEKERRI